MKQKLRLLFVAAAICCMLYASSVFAAYTFVDGGKSMAGATVISIGPEYASTLGEDEVLYYKFKTPAGKGFIDFYAKNINIYQSYPGIQFVLMDAVQEKITSIGLSTDSEATHNVELEPSTTYYIKVYAPYSGKSGNFKIQLAFTPDKVGDTKSTATTISLDRKIAGTLDGENDVDVYKFKTGKWSKYIFSTQNISISTGGGFSYRIRIKSEIDEIMGEHDLGHWNGNSGSKEVVLEPNTIYYIMVSHDGGRCGQYTFSVIPNRIDITNAITSYKSKYTYTGKAITPNVTVTYNGKTLVRGIDYTLSYTANKNTGVGKIILTGIGNYGGRATLSFQIVPKKASVSVKSTKKGKLTVSVKKDKQASGYQIKYGTKFSFKGAKTRRTARTSYTMKATKGKTYYVKVRSYKKVGNTVVYGSWSKTKKVRIKK